MAEGKVRQQSPCPGISVGDEPVECHGAIHKLHSYRRERTKRRLGGQRYLDADAFATSHGKKSATGDDQDDQDDDDDGNGQQAQYTPPPTTPNPTMAPPTLQPATMTGTPASAGPLSPTLFVNPNNNNGASTPTAGGGPMMTPNGSPTGAPASGGSVTTNGGNTSPSASPATPTTTNGGGGGDDTSQLNTLSNNDRTVPKRNNDADNNNSGDDHDHRALLITMWILIVLCLFVLCGMCFGCLREEKRRQEEQEAKGKRDLADLDHHSLGTDDSTMILEPIGATPHGDSFDEEGAPTNESAALLPTTPSDSHNLSPPPIQRSSRMPPSTPEERRTLESAHDKDHKPDSDQEEEDDDDCGLEYLCDGLSPPAILRSRQPPSSSSTSPKDDSPSPPTEDGVEILEAEYMASFDLISETGNSPKENDQDEDDEEEKKEEENSYPGYVQHLVGTKTAGASEGDQSHGGNVDSRSTTPMPDSPVSQTRSGVSNDGSTMDTPSKPQESQQQPEEGNRSSVSSIAYSSLFSGTSAASPVFRRFSRNADESKDQGGIRILKANDRTQASTTTDQDDAPNAAGTSSATSTSTAKATFHPSSSQDHDECRRAVSLLGSSSESEDSAENEVAYQLSDDSSSSYLFEGPDSVKLSQTKDTKNTEGQTMTEASDDEPKNENEDFQTKTVEVDMEFVHKQEPPEKVLPVEGERRIVDTRELLVMPTPRYPEEKKDDSSAPVMRSRSFESYNRYRDALRASLHSDRRDRSHSWDADLGRERGLVFRRQSLTDRENDGDSDRSESDDDLDMDDDDDDDEGEEENHAEYIHRRLPKDSENNPFASASSRPSSYRNSVGMWIQSLAEQRSARQQLRHQERDRDHEHEQLADVSSNPIDV